MFKELLASPWARLGLLTGVLVLLAALCWMLSTVLVPLLFAFLVAYALDPVVDAFERRGIPRPAAIGILGFVSLLALVLTPILVVPSLIQQANDLITAAPQQVGEETLTQWADAIIEKLPLAQTLHDVGWLEKREASTQEIRAALAKGIGSLVRDNAVRVLKDNASTLASAGQQAGATAMHVLAAASSGTLRFIAFVGNLALFAFVAGYLLNDFDRLTASIGKLIPLRYRPRAVDIMSKIDVQMRSFLRGQVAVCICLGVMYAIGLLCAGVPFAVLLAAFGAVASFVPYMGLVLTIVPSVFLALVQHGIDWHILAVGATFVVAQMTEGFFLTPKIVGQQVGLHPVWVILAIMVFGGAFGLVGVLIAVPLAAALKVLVVEGVEYYRESAFFSDSSSAPPSADA